MLFSGLLLPALPGASAGLLWVLLGAAAAAASLVAAFAFPAADPIADSAGSDGEPTAKLGGAPFWGLVILYSTIAVGYIPHTVFWVDFLARALGTGLGPGGTAWMVFGVGALVGPPIGGWVAARRGFGGALRLGVVGLALVLLIPLATGNGWLLGASSLAAGMLAVGAVSLVAGRSAELVAPAARRRAWAVLTVLFALCQGGGAWALSRLLAMTDSYLPLFATAAGLLIAALIVEVALARAR
jgi:predicted MFS family arabinose efflux permease